MIPPAPTRLPEIRSRHAATCSARCSISSIRCSPISLQGNARVRLDAAAAHFDRAAADLEGFARPLWGLAPFAAGGGSFAHWDRYAEGIANGTDPEHPEYWGQVNGRDQRMVELAALGFALALAPEKLWDPLERA
jgi:hypothetical protein